MVAPKGGEDKLERRQWWWPWVVLARRGSGEGDKQGTSYSRGSGERVLGCIDDNWIIDRLSDLNH